MYRLVQGDLFNSIESDQNIYIPHICNNLGVMGAGFVIPLTKKFPIVKQEYTNKGNWPRGYTLGKVQFITVQKNPNIVVCNMIAQNGLISKHHIPINYEALESCMEIVKKHMQEDKNIIAPKFGSGLAGGDWNIIEKMIHEIWIRNNKNVTIYYL